MNRRHFLRTFLIALGAAPAIAKSLAASALIDPPERIPVRRVGPLQEMDYVNLVFAEWPAGSGSNVNEAKLTRENGSVDIFRLRPTLNKESRDHGSKTWVSRLVWNDACRVVDGHEIELESFQLSINIPRSDIYDGGMPCRIDEVVIEPPEITVSWQEVVRE